MRILILSNLFPPYIKGGYELACRNVAIGLVKRGHTVEVLAAHAPMPTPEDPEWLRRVFALRAFDPVAPHTGDLIEAKDYEASASQYANTAVLLDRVHTFRPDLVYAWHIWGIGGLALLDLCELVGVPWVLHLMDCVPTYLLSAVAPLAASLFARDHASLLTRGRFISMSSQIVTEIKLTTGVSFDRPPDFIPGWVDATGLAQRTEYIQSGQLRLVTAGSLGTHKGTDIILKACALLLARAATSFHVDIFALNDTGPWVTEAARLGLQKHVSFHSSRTQADLLAVLHQYDAFLFPTQEREPFGFAAIEAAACGAIPIITRNAGVAERLVDGVHALKIDRTPDSLANAIQLLLDGEVDAATIGRRAARLVRRDFSFARCLDRIEATLEVVPRTSYLATLEEPRLRVAIFAKHALGQLLTAYR